MNFKDRSAAKSEVINLLGSAEAWIVRNQTALALFILAIGAGAATLLGGRMLS